MGNCCECSSAGSSENLAEVLIKNSIKLLKIRNMYYQEFHDSIVEDFGMFITEVKNKNKMITFINEESYDKFINENIINYNHDQNLIKNQKLSCVKFNLSHLDGFGMNYILALWALANLSNDFESKMEFVFKIIKDTEKYLNFKNFSKFLLRYLRVNLNIVTKNFILSEEYNTDLIIQKDLKILNKLFSSVSLQRYVNKIMDSLKIVLKMNNENLNLADIENEFLSDSLITNFFSNNSNLLDIIQLRESVYIFSRGINGFSFN